MAVVPPRWALVAAAGLLLVALAALQACSPVLRNAAWGVDEETHAAGTRHRLEQQRVLIEDTVEKGGNVVDSTLDFVKDAMDWVDDEGLKHEAAYLGYESPSPDQEMDRWYHTITPKRSSDDTYFAVSGTSFGYLGLQQVRDKPYFQGKVVFSIWDKGGEADEGSGDQAELVECGEQAVCSRFGGEGTGAHSHINFWDWKIMNAYAFMTRALDVGNGSARYEGYLYAPEYGGWVLCAKIQVRRGKVPWHITGMYSFVEHWSYRAHGDARWAMLGPSFARFGNGTDPVDGDPWKQIRTAKFTSTWEEDKSNVNANVTNNDTMWGLGIGGNVSVGEQHMELTVDVCEEFPDALLEFETLEQNGILPSGCLGGTCWHRRIIAFLREQHSSSKIRRTGLIELVFLILVFSTAYSCGCCCRCCYPKSWLRDEEGYSEVDDDTEVARPSFLCCGSKRPESDTAPRMPTN